MKTNSGKFKAVKTVKKAKTVKAVISLKKEINIVLKFELIS
ncbi:MAG: hypothetical protein ACLUR5_11020 [Eubacterium ventriosum]